MEREVPKELMVLRHEQGVALEPLADLKVTDKASMEKAAGGLSVIRDLLKRIEKTRLLLVKPMKDHASWIDGEARKAKQPLRAAESHLSGEMVEYRRQLEEKRREEELRVQKLAEKRRAKAEAENRPPPVAEELVTTVKAPPKTVVTEAGVITFQKIRKWELEDISAVPIQYLELNKSAITKAVKGGEEQIPGLRIWVEDNPVSR